MNIFTRLYYQYRRFAKAIRLFLLTAGPGIIVMDADNDAGGITTYTAPAPSTACTFSGSLSSWGLSRTTSRR